MARERDSAQEGADAFWRFAVAVYTRSGVSERCLALQDSYGADVNILLFAAWLGAARERAVAQDGARFLIDETAHWREAVVQDMRRLRRKLKQEIQGRPEADHVYQSMKASELEAEKAEHRILVEALARLKLATAEPDAPDAVALTNMKAYLAALDVPLDAEAGEHLEAIAAAAAARQG